MKNIGIVISVPTDRHRRRSRSLLERNARELDNIIILREFIKHLRHLRIALYNVGQTIERRVVEDVANHVRVNAKCYCPLFGQAKVFLLSSLSRLRDRNLSSSLLYSMYGMSPARKHTAHEI